MLARCYVAKSAVCRGLFFCVQGAFITCRIDALHVNDIQVLMPGSPVVGGANAQTAISLADAQLSSSLF